MHIVDKIKYDIKSADKTKLDVFNDVLKLIQFSIDCLGIFLFILLMPLISFIGNIVQKEHAQNIILHLDGNRNMFDMFYQITFSRALLRLDFVFNLEYFTTFVFILISDEKKDHPSIYYIVGGLFVFTNLTIAFARYVALGSDIKTWYFIYFTMRFIVEVVKLAIVI